MDGVPVEQRLVRVLRQAVGAVVVLELQDLRDERRPRPHGEPPPPVVVQRRGPAVAAHRPDVDGPQLAVAAEGDYDGERHPLPQAGGRRRAPGPGHEARRRGGAGPRSGGLLLLGEQVRREPAPLVGARVETCSGGGLDVDPDPLGPVQGGAAAVGARRVAQQRLHGGLIEPQSAGPTSIRNQPSLGGRNMLHGSRTTRRDRSGRPAALTANPASTRSPSGVAVTS